MNLRRIVLITVILFALFMSSVVVYGFVQKQKSTKNTTSTSDIQDTATNNNQTQSSSTQSSPTAQQLTSIEVAKHNTISDCYIIISGNVYDVGKFLDLHPGGADVVTPFCGRDATGAFATKGGKGNSHSQSARASLQQFLLGPLQ